MTPPEMNLKIANRIAVNYTHRLWKLRGCRHECFQFLIKQRQLLTRVLSVVAANIVRSAKRAKLLRQESV